MTTTHEEVRPAQRPRRTDIRTQIDLYDGSRLIALGSPEAVWDTEAGGHLTVHWDGGGFAVIPKCDVKWMELHRRGVSR